MTTPELHVVRRERLFNASRFNTHKPGKESVGTRIIDFIALNVSPLGKSEVAADNLRFVAETNGDIPLDARKLEQLESGKSLVSVEHVENELGTQTLFVDLYTRMPNDQSIRNLTFDLTDEDHTIYHDYVATNFKPRHKTALFTIAQVCLIEQLAEMPQIDNIVQLHPNQL